MSGGMIIYKVFCKNYELKRGELMGMLIERRKDLRGMTQIESGLRWAKLSFGPMVKDKKAVFVVPRELRLRSDTRWLKEKAVFTREELLGMGTLVDGGGYRAKEM
jgi:hypothetical protein